MTNVIIGIDLAKTVFQIQKMNEKREVISRYKLRRSEIRPFLEQQDTDNSLIPIRVSNGLSAVCGLSPTPI